MTASGESCRSVHGLQQNLAERLLWTGSCRWDGGVMNGWKRPEAVSRSQRWYVFYFVESVPMNPNDRTDEFGHRARPSWSASKRLAASSTPAQSLFAT